jgi:nucleoside-diphosphate-sugar epimerase
MTTSERFLVTGAGGFIGKRLVARLQATGAEVLAWTRDTGDLTEARAVQATVAGFAPSFIVHLAAGSSAVAEADWKHIAAEVAMLDNIARAMPSSARLVHCGSVAEIGRSGRLAEDEPVQPRSVYGFAKAAATDRALALSTMGFDVRVARLFNVYGPGEAQRRLVPHLVTHLLAGQPVLLSDAEQVRDFVHVDDVCDCLLALARLDAVPWPMLNIGTGIGVSVGDVARRVANCLGADQALLRFGELPRRPIDEDVLVAEVGRLSALGLLPVQHWLEEQGAVNTFIAGLAQTAK